VKESPSEFFCRIFQKILVLRGRLCYLLATFTRLIINTGGIIVKNVDISIEGNMLIIKVDLSKEYGESSSGKSTIIATTEGNYALPGREEKVGLNVYRKKKS